MSIACLVPFAACDDSRPPVSGGLVAVGQSTTGPSFTGDASTGLPGCGEQDSGAFCQCVDTPLFTDAPNIYFVLDRSGSMATDNKWGTVRDVVASTMRSLGPRANVGATVFPGFSSASCGSPAEIMSLRPGDPPGNANGANVQTLLNATSGDPFGGTPTASALAFVRSKLSGAKGKTFVVLATDGGPNCNGSITCSAALCQPNIEGQAGCPVNGTPNCCESPEGSPESCLDSMATIDAVSNLKEVGIPVYVIGLPGTTTYGSLLDTLATTGGTAQPTGPTRYYAVTTAGEAELLATLKTIAAKITATCDFQLASPPVDPTLVNVYFDEQVLPADPVNGWKLVGSTVTLLGTACSQVLNGDVLDVRIIAGCPTVEPR